MAELNYYCRPTKGTKVLHRRLWDKLSKEFPISVLSKDYGDMWLVVFKNGEKRFLSQEFIEKRIYE